MTPGFQRIETPQLRLWLAEDYRAELSPLALETPDALERWCRGGSPVPGGRARGWRVPLGSGRCVHVREMAHGGILRGLTGRRFRSPDRAEAACIAADALSARGVPVPAPVLLLARRRGAFWQLWIANQWLPGCLAGGAFLEQASRDAARVGARRAGAALRRFHDAGASHPDLHVDNLLVECGERPDHEPGRVWIVDLDGVRLGAVPPNDGRRRELERLRRSLRKRDLAPADRTRFLDALVEGYLEKDAPADGVRLREALRAG